MQVQEKDIKTLMSPAGFVWETTIPRKEDGGSEHYSEALNYTLISGLRMRMGSKVHNSLIVFFVLAGSSKGFGFASFTSRSHAEKGIKLANGKASPLFPGRSTGTVQHTAKAQPV